MTFANDFNTPDANEAGVEMIIPDTTVTATEESNVIVDAAAAPPKPKWTTKGVSIAGVGALCVIAVGYGTKYTGSPTSSSQQQQMQQTAIEATLFEPFSDGYCLDSQSNDYPYIGYAGVSSAEECGNMCSMCPGNNQGGLVLRGFEYFGPSNACVCLVDFDSIGFDKTVCAGADFARDTYKGSGEIVNTVPFPCPGNECWKVSSPSSSKARKSSKAPKSSKRPVRKLGQKNDNLLSNVERKTDSQTIIE